jgi:hypothetical protein
MPDPEASMRQVRIAFILFQIIPIALLPTACHAPFVPLQIAEQYTDGTGSLCMSWGTGPGGVIEVAQSFQVTETTVCRGVALEFYSRLNTPTGDYSVRLEPDTAGAPAGVPVAARGHGSRNAAGLTLHAWNDWLFDGPVTLVAGQSYWIVCRTTEPVSGGNVLFWVVMVQPGGYAKGEARRSIGSGPWEITGNDMNFRIYK